MQNITLKLPTGDISIGITNSELIYKLKDLVVTNTDMLRLFEIRLLDNSYTDAEILKDNLYKYELARELSDFLLQNTIVDIPEKLLLSETEEVRKSVISKYLELNVEFDQNNHEVTLYISSIAYNKCKIQLGLLFISQILEIPSNTESETLKKVLELIG